MVNDPHLERCSCRPVIPWQVCIGHSRIFQQSTLISELAIDFLASVLFPQADFPTHAWPMSSQRVSSSARQSSTCPRSQPSFLSPRPLRRRSLYDYPCYLITIILGSPRTWLLGESASCCTHRKQAMSKSFLECLVNTLEVRSHYCWSKDCSSQYRDGYWMLSHYS